MEERKEGILKRLWNKRCESLRSSRRTCIDTVQTSQKTGEKAYKADFKQVYGKMLLYLRG